MVSNLSPNNRAQRTLTGPFVDQRSPSLRSSKAAKALIGKYTKNEAWFAAHPNVKFRFTPTSVNWENQVGIFAWYFNEKGFARGKLQKNIDAVTAAIKEFTKAYHKDAKPFVWKKREVKGSQLKYYL
ncbi:MAG: hypothetical protein LLG04_07870 [Parachlamydia sp.]|nr:hypothetical protein [Parachlamydia sp.]